MDLAKLVEIEKKITELTGKYSGYAAENESLKSEIEKLREANGRLSASVKKESLRARKLEEDIRRFTVERKSIRGRIMKVISQIENLSDTTE